MLNFNPNEDYILEDDFVRLSPLQLEHIEQLIDIANEAGIWTYSFQKGNGIKNLTEYIQSTLNKRQAGTEYPFIVFDKRKNQFAGSTRFCEIASDLQAIRLGYTWYGKAFRGTGLNKHCKYLLFEFAFETMGAERIGMAAYRANRISIAAMKNVGCQEEGVLRGIFPAVEGTGRTDAILLSILKRDWEHQAKAALKKKLNIKPA
ncbi:MAG: GNAT family protein [Bacteroidota bacterium]